MRFFTLGRKLHNLSLAACHVHMAQRHAPLVLACRGFRDFCEHYRQNHIQGDVDPGLAELHVRADPVFHYCSEFWYQDVDALIHAYHETDYFAMLRPDVQLWSDPAERLAFMAEEAWILGKPQPPRTDGSIKLLVLHKGHDGGWREGPPSQARHAEFFARCLHVSCNLVSGQMDFARAVARSAGDLPFQTMSELWFDSEATAREALNCRDGKRLLDESGWLPRRAEEGAMLWARERVVF